MSILPSSALAQAPALFSVSWDGGDSSEGVDSLHSAGVNYKYFEFYKYHAFPLIRSHQWTWILIILILKVSILYDIFVIALLISLQKPKKLMTLDYVLIKE